MSHQAVSERSDVGRRALQDFRSLLNNKRLSNVAFLCQDNVVVYADKALLAVRSDYFDRLLTAGLKESNQDEIRLPVESSHLLIVFEYMHGNLCLPDDPKPELAMGVYELSRQYTIDDLQEELREAILKLLSYATVASFLALAYKVLCMYMSSECCSLIYFLCNCSSKVQCIICTV